MGDKHVSHLVEQPSPAGEGAQETPNSRIPSAWADFGDGHDYSYTGKHDPNSCRWCLRDVLKRYQALPPERAALVAGLERDAATLMAVGREPYLTIAITLRLAVAALRGETGE